MLYRIFGLRTTRNHYFEYDVTELASLIQIKSKDSEKLVSIITKLKKFKFSKKHEKYCQYCVHGKLLEYTDEVFCAKKGFVNKFGKCIKYKYDPLKRNPESSVVTPEFKPEDFAL